MTSKFQNRERWEEGIVREFEVDMYTLSFKMDNQ